MAASFFGGNGAAIASGACDGPCTPDDTLAAARGARHPALVLCIFRHEVGGGVPGYAPYDPGMPHGESVVHGPAGLHERGLLPEYQRWALGALGTDDPTDPYAVAAFVDRMADEQRVSQNWPYRC